MKKSLLLILCCFAIKCYSQPCNCDSNFIWLKKYVETNYAGFKAKVTQVNIAEYEAYSKKDETILKQCDKPAYCEYYILQWLKFFKDLHNQIQYDEGKAYTAKDENDTAFIHQLNAKTESLPIDSAAFANELIKQKNTGIEGIYRMFDSSYTIAIIKSKNNFRDYAGVILSSKTKLWHKGQVKLELKQISDSAFNVIEYMRNHTFIIIGVPFKIVNNKNIYAPGWKRIVPAEQLTNAVNEFDWNSKYDADYKNIDKQTSYLKIRSFEDMWASQIDSVVRANMKDIKSHPYMILDLRYNGGGSDGSYFPLLPIIYCNPVITDGVDVYSTPDNIAAIEKLFKEDTNLSKDDKHSMDSIITVMKAHPYQFVCQSPDDTVTSDSIMPYPEKVVILMNQYCGSTTEQFLLFAKDCKKVTLMGEHSAGILDYSNVRPVAFPCLPGRFYYSTTVSCRIAKNKGIDGKGISPKIKLNPDIDWILAAKKYLEQNKLPKK